uniref:Uncharacterized protein n=1 Tax=Rhizophora mucronata TaxID=61149 RepID=A0A2P2PLA7_RHIMU
MDLSQPTALWGSIEKKIGVLNSWDCALDFTNLTVRLIILLLNCNEMN